MKIFISIFQSLGGFLIFFLLLLWMSCIAPNNNSSVDSSLVIGKSQTVEVVQAKPQVFEAEIVITGNAAPNQKVTVYAMESGYVETLNADIGDKVLKGAVLAKLTHPQLTRDLEKSKAFLQAKQTLFERLKKVYEQTPALISLQQFEDAEAEFNMAQTEYNALQEKVGFLNIRAPFQGKVTKRYVDVGNLVQSGLSEDNPQKLFEIQETDPIRVKISLPESDARYVQEGMPVEIVFPELNQQKLKAQISRIAGALDPASKTMQVEIDIPNPKNQILPGMYAKIQLQVESRNEVLALPLSSKIMYKNEPNLLVIRDSIAVMMPIKSGLSNKSFFEVIEHDLQATDWVVTQGKGLVKPGQKVIPIPQSSLAP